VLARSSTRAKEQTRTHLGSPLFMQLV
jgi:hypothetical protein